MVTGEELRTLMRRIPASVAVVAVPALGLTVGSVLSLSLAPPLVGVSLSRESALHELLREEGSFAVSFLGAGQEHLGQRFARGIPPFAHWEGVEHRPGSLTGAPLLEGALGWLECRLAAEHVTGDHTLFVGEVLSVQLGAELAPIVFRGGAYAPL